MKKNLVLLVALIVSLSVNAMVVKRVTQGVLLNNVVTTEPAMYLIEGNCTLSGDVTLAAGSILKFEGGKIDGTGKILGTRLMIDAPKYKIFGDDINVSGIANGEVSAHWWGAVGDGVTNDYPAISKAIEASGTSWVVLENLRYLISETIVLGTGQKLRCNGAISYQGEQVAIDLRSPNIEIDIYELRQNAGTGFNQEALFKGSGILFSGNVYNSNINVDRILYFNKAFELAPSHLGKPAERYKGIQYCKISWQYVVGEYGIYIDMVSGMLLDGVARRTWVNENQFNGGRLLCRYGIYSTPVSDIYRDYIGLINGNVFNCIGFEGEGNVKCKAITLYNAWHNNFNDLRLSEGYVPIGETWIELTQCGYLNFSFKSLLPYSSVKATKCNHIKLDGAFCGEDTGYYKEFDRMYLLNEDPMINPLRESEDIDTLTFKLLTRDFVPSAEFKSIYLGATQDDPTGNEIQNISFDDLFYVHNGNVVELSNKCFITVNDNSTLNISTSHTMANSYFNFEMVCKISSDSKIVITNSEGKRIVLTESGVYHVNPIGGEMKLYLVKNSGNNVFEFK